MNKLYKDSTIVVVGLGYVGLPLAVEFGTIRPTIGFDISRSRVEELISGNDRTLEIEAELLLKSSKLRFTADVDQLKERPNDRLSKSDGSSLEGHDP